MSAADEEMEVLATVRIVIYRADRSEFPLAGVDLDWSVSEIRPDDAFALAAEAIDAELAARRDTLH